MAQKLYALAALTGLVTTAAADKPTSFIRANFHAHAARDHVADDGAEAPAALHRALAAEGFDFSVHSPHSTVNMGHDAAANFRAQRAAEAELDVGVAIAVGEELTVAAGPNFQSRTQVLGHPAPGNLNHLTLLGMKELVPSGTPLAAACDRVHADGGLCIVNHPGPGPMMWEEGLWEAPQNRGKIDALEVYNGQALSAIAIDFEARYLEATSYGGLGLRIAATTGADTHGPRSVERARSRLAGLGVASKLLKLVMPRTGVPRPELGAATLVQAEHATEAEVIAAVKARHTIATYDFARLTVECRGLGEVRATGDVALEIRFSRKLAEVTLYREGSPVRSWHDVDRAEWKESVTQPTAFVWSARDGSGRLTTSAIWFEPRGAQAK
jgi:hypothetical protein